MRKPSILLVSIDALKPEFVLRQERLGIRLPFLHEEFVRGGVFASEGVRSVFPSFTYACHQSIITGTYPVTHGTCNNVLFDPENVHRGAWNWWTSDRVPNLWELAREHGYCSASVAFPTSLGAKGDFILPEFWWDGSDLDARFLDVMCRPQGLVSEMLGEVGYCPGGLDLTLNGDRHRKKCASWVLRHKIRPCLAEKPFFLTTYFASFDQMAHDHGVYSPEAMGALETIDTLLGELVAEVRAAAGEEVVLCVISDHGTLDNAFNIRPNVLLKREGFITLDAQDRVRDWKAWSQRAGGIAEIRLKDPADTETRGRVGNLLESLSRDQGMGIQEVLSGDQARKVRRGFAQADFVLIARKGYEIRDEATGEYRTSELAQKAQHGYDENFEEMRASFYLSGKAVPRGRDIGSLNLVDIAPTLAEFMGFQIPGAEGESLLSRCMLNA